MDFVSFTLIVDDIVFPDGSSKMAALGGGGPQTAFGYQLWCFKEARRVGLAAGVGPDLPEECLQWLHEMGIDTGGLILSALATPRAWQIVEDDGRRTQVWRSEESSAMFAMLRPAMAILPPHYRRATTYHIGVHPERPNLDYLQEIRACAREAGAKKKPPDNAMGDDTNRTPRSGVLSIEPFTAARRMLSREEVEGLCSVGDIFSPNEIEAFSIVGPGSPVDVVERIAEAGAKVVILRRGPQGSVVYDSQTGEMWEIPAVPDSEVVDVTGCGNAYNGGFLAAWERGEGILTAGVWGSVAASFMLASRGVPSPPLSAMLEQALSRATLVRRKSRLIKSR